MKEEITDGNKNNNFKENPNKSENNPLMSSKTDTSKQNYFKDYFQDMKEQDSSTKLNLERYKSTKLFGITFYHIGNLYVFGFINDSSEPLFCLDKKWYLHLIILFIEIILAFVGNYYLFIKLELWKLIIYNILLLLLCLNYNALIILNPGIIIKSQKGYMHTGYCKKCNIYFIPENNLYHCYDCDICVRNIDHHCTVVSKCITKKNFILFISMIVIFVIYYVYTLVNLIFFCVDFFKKKKKL